ncbi:MAG: prepilin-type N-terminal cleavage/methylation domain-containing protein [Candidatus Riflebacteria bacterium]|nr:prepilin-type N-terminal cleavage/methylation domain-containing protein [Candidatus Riflebacteria bacterium]
MNRIESRTPGFTLVELLVGMTLMILVGGVLYLFQSSALSTVSKGVTRLTMQSEVRLKLERMVSDFRGANEVLDVTESSIRISRYGSGGEDAAVGDAALVTVSYELMKIKGTKRFALYRSENREAPVELISADNIESEIFYPMYEDLPSTDPDALLYLPFDMHTNDSGQRKRISFLRLHIKMRQNREFVTITTSVSLRGAHQRLSQPAWKFR